MYLSLSLLWEYKYYQPRRYALSTYTSKYKQNTKSCLIFLVPNILKSCVTPWDPAVLLHKKQTSDWVHLQDCCRMDL